MIEFTGAHIRLLKGGGEYMKKTALIIIGTLLVLISVGLVLYPFISNYLMGLNQQAEIEGYRRTIESADDTTLDDALKAANEYNRSLFGEVVLTDPFDPSFMAAGDAEYNSLLNIDGTGVMGYVEIPKIEVYLPICHGTSREVLEKGAGHLQNTSLPVGGEGTHAVITGHTGLSTARLFTDIHQLEKGDVFYLHVLKETLAYEVDQILVVLPNETDPLRVVPDRDLVTLMTCTPYGVNSHRLLVRGKRIPYTEAPEQQTAAVSPPVASTWMAEYRKAVIAGFILLAVLISAIVTVVLIVKRRRRKRAAREEG